jgi:hypothetical protein
MVCIAPKRTTKIKSDSALCPALLFGCRFGSLFCLCSLALSSPHEEAQEWLNQNKSKSAAGNGASTNPSAGASSSPSPALLPGSPLLRHTTSAAGSVPSPVPSPSPSLMSLHSSSTTSTPILSPQQYSIPHSGSTASSAAASAPTSNSGSQRSKSSQPSPIHTFLASPPAPAPIGPLPAHPSAAASAASTLSASTASVLGSSAAAAVSSTAVGSAAAASKAPLSFSSVLKQSALKPVAPVGTSAGLSSAVSKSAPSAATAGSGAAKGASVKRSGAFQTRAEEHEYYMQYFRTEECVEYKNSSRSKCTCTVCNASSLPPLLCFTRSAVLGQGFKYHFAKDRRRNPTDFHYSPMPCDKAYARSGSGTKKTWADEPQITCPKGTCSFSSVGLMLLLTLHLLVCCVLCRRSVRVCAHAHGTDVPSGSVQDSVM